jgi:hypothetical protein
MERGEHILGDIRGGDHAVPEGTGSA